MIGPITDGRSACKPRGEENETYRDWYEPDVKDPNIPEIQASLASFGWEPKETTL